MYKFTLENAPNNRFPKSLENFSPPRLSLIARIATYFAVRITLIAAYVLIIPDTYNTSSL